MSQLLHSKIAAVRSKQAMLAVVRGGCAIAAAAVLLLGAEMLLDWFIDLPWAVRAGFLAVTLAALVYILLWFVIAPVVFGPDDESLALLVERHVPAFRTRLIASIQLARPGAVPAGSSPSLARAMITQTEDIAAPMNFADVVRADSTLKAASVSALIVVLGVAAVVYGREVTGDLLKRAFLSNVPVPRNTRVHALTEDIAIAIGDPVTLEARATGIIPSTGTVRISYDSGRKQSFSIEPLAADKTRFARTIDNVQESFDYRVQLNDGYGRWFKVRALPRPTVVSADFIQDFPPYTRLPRLRKSPGDLSLLVGSQVTVQVKASKRIAKGHIRLVGLERDVDMVPNMADRTQLSGRVDVPARGLLGLSIQLVDEDGIPSKGETVYPVDLVQDKEPTIRITWPDRKEELATSKAKALIAFEASDDYGVDKVLLHYVVDEKQPGGNYELDLTAERAKAGDDAQLRNLRLRHEFDLSRTNALLEGAVVEYWLEVRDANNVTGPGKAFSDRFKIKVVSEVEKRADLMNRLNDQLGVVDFLTSDQEKLEQRLGALVLEKQK